MEAWGWWRRGGGGGVGVVEAWGWWRHHCSLLSSLLRTSHALPVYLSTPPSTTSHTHPQSPVITLPPPPPITLPDPHTHPYSSLNLPALYDSTHSLLLEAAS